MSFSEGAYRLEGGEWQVVIVSKDDIDDTKVRSSTWDSGVTGVVITIPRGARLDKMLVETLLSDQFGVTEWVEVRGPDSMTLR